METDQQKKILRRQFIADAIGGVLVVNGLSTILWGTSDEATITETVEKQIVVLKDQLVKAHETISRSITIFEQHAREGTLEKIIEDVDEQLLQKAIKLKDEEIKQIILKAELSNKKHLNEKLIVGFLGLLTGAISFIATRDLQGSWDKPKIN